MRLRPNSLVAYEQNYRLHIKPRWGHIPMGPVVPIEIQEYRTEMRKTLGEIGGPAVGSGDLTGSAGMLRHVEDRAGAVAGSRHQPLATDAVRLVGGTRAPRSR